MQDWIQGLRPAKERRRHKATPSLIGYAQTWNQQPCKCIGHGVDSTELETS